VHVGAVEQRIALAQHNHVAAGFEFARDFARSLVVKCAQHVAIAGAAFRDFGGDRKDERQLGDAAAQMRRSDTARVARFAALGKERHHLGVAQGARGLQGHKLRIARADADTDQPAEAVHIPALASALTAAAVIALPPMRPRTVTNGMPRAFSTSMALDSAAPTKPTGMPTIAAGFGPPPSISSSKRNNAVGALPIATTAPLSPSSQRSSAAAEHVVPFCSASPAARESLSVQTTALRAGSRERVTPCATISESQKIGAPAASAPRAAATRSPPNAM